MTYSIKKTSLKTIHDLKVKRVIANIFIGVMTYLYKKINVLKCITLLIKNYIDIKFRTLRGRSVWYFKP